MSATVPAQPVLPAITRFGVATASYQIEGAVGEDGRGPSIWDTFSHTPGVIAGGDTGDVACDHYHRYPEDVALMRELGVDAYRFSVAWPRIQPAGTGPANPAGIAFYDRLVDALLAAGVDPVVTLYHWDLPQPLEDAGGWPDRDTAHRFADYAEIVHGALGDRVQQWITLNEPFCSSILGYAEGRHAPGRQEGKPALAAAHHLLVGHGLAVQRMRAARPDQQYGITLNFSPTAPADPDHPEDVAAAARSHVLQNTLFADPVLAGRYAAQADEVWPAYGAFDFVHDGDLETTSVPLDFLGVNYYFPSTVAAEPPREADPARRTADDIGARIVVPPGSETTEMGWPVDAGGLERLLRWLHETYPGVPAFEITENGRACADAVVDGRVEDPERISYLAQHLGAVGSSIAAGVPVRAYFCWSLMDNFEWAEGYAKRFGLYYVDFETQQRFPKSSARWYAELARGHRDRR